MQQHMDHLKQLKDFDENIALEKKARALEEQEKMKAKVITTSENVNLLSQLQRMIYFLYHNKKVFG